jgi:hypothetical protein
MTATTYANPSEDLVVIVTRIFDAPRELVFKMFTDPMPGAVLNPGHRRRELSSRTVRIFGRRAMSDRALCRAVEKD